MTEKETENETIQNAPEIIHEIAEAADETDAKAYGLAQRLGARINGDEEDQFYSDYENVELDVEGYHTIKVSLYGETNDHSPPVEIHEFVDETEYRIGSFAAMNEHDFADRQGNTHSACLVVELVRDDPLVGNQESV